jgi:hypothetical protein
MLDAILSGLKSLRDTARSLWDGLKRVVTDGLEFLTDVYSKTVSAVGKVIQLALRGAYGAAKWLILVAQMILQTPRFAYMALRTGSVQMWKTTWIIVITSFWPMCTGGPAPQGTLYLFSEEAGIPRPGTTPLIDPTTRLQTAAA